MNPSSKTPQAKDWNNSERKAEQLMKRIMYHGYPLWYGAHFYEPEGWQTKRVRGPPELIQLLVMSRGRRAQHDSGRLTVGAHHQDTWRNQSGKWDEWQWLIQLHIVTGGDCAAWTGHFHREKEVSEGELSCRWPEYQLGRMFVRRFFLIFQLLDLKTWTLPWPREANELEKSVLSWLTWDTLGYFVN